MVDKVVDVDAMIADLRKEVVKTYMFSLDNNQTTFIADNPPLELLQEIEQKIVERQEYIEERRNNVIDYPTAADEIKKLEIHCKNDFKMERKRAEDKKLNEETEKLKQKLKDRAKEQRKREGKI